MSNNINSNSDSDTSEYEIIKSPTENFNKLYYKLFKITALSNIVSKLKKFKIQHNLCYNIIDFLDSDEYKQNFNKTTEKKSSNNISKSNDLSNELSNELSNDLSNDLSAINNAINTPINNNIPKKRSLEERLKLERELMKIEDINITQQNKQQKINNNTFNNNLPTVIQKSSTNNDINLPTVMKQSFTPKVSRKSVKSIHLKTHIRNNFLLQKMIIANY